MAGNRRDVETDIIGRDRFSQAARSAGRGAQEAKSRMDKLKDGFAKASAAGLALGAAVAVASKMLDQGLKNALSKATAEVALGTQGYAKLSAEAEKSAHSLGLSKAEFIAAAGQTARLTANLGFSQEAAAAFGSAMPGLADKLSLLSAGQVSAAEASDMMRAALAGEFDPLQTLGLAISAARVEREAANIQTREGGKLTSEQAKALAVQEIVTRQTKIATKVAATESGKQAEKVKEAKAQLKEFADAITAQALPALAGLTGALSDNVKDTAEADGFLSKLGNGVKTAGTGWEVYWNWLGKITGETQEQTGAAEKSAAALGGQAQAATLSGKAIAGSGQAALEAAAAQDRLAARVEKATVAQEKMAGSFLEARGIYRGYQAALDAATESVKENGKTLNINTEKGRRNQEALDGVADAAIRQGIALRESGASQRAMNEQQAASRKQLEKTALSFGLSKKAAKAYADQVFGIPAARATKVTAEVSAAKASIAGFESRFSALGKMVAKPYVNPNLTPAKAAVDGFEARLRALGAINVKPSITVDTSSALVKIDTLVSRIAILRGKIGVATSAANNANNREGRGANFAAGGSWAGGSGGRVGGPADVSVTTNVSLDGAPFYAMTQSAAQVATSRAAHRARVGRR